MSFVGENSGVKMGSEDWEKDEPQCYSEKDEPQCYSDKDEPQCYLEGKVLVEVHLRAKV